MVDLTEISPAGFCKEIAKEVADEQDKKQTYSAALNELQNRLRRGVFGGKREEQKKRKEAFEEWAKKSIVKHLRDWSYKMDRGPDEKRAMIDAIKEIEKLWRKIIRRPRARR